MSASCRGRPGWGCREHAADGLSPGCPGEGGSSGRLGGDSRAGSRCESNPEDSMRTWEPAEGGSPAAQGYLGLHDHRGGSQSSWGSRSPWVGGPCGVQARGRVGPFSPLRLGRRVSGVWERGVERVAAPACRFPPPMACRSLRPAGRDRRAGVLTPSPAEACGSPHAAPFPTAFRGFGLMWGTRPQLQCHTAGPHRSRSPRAPPAAPPRPVLPPVFHCPRSHAFCRMSQSRSHTARSCSGGRRRWETCAEGPPRRPAA